MLVPCVASIWSVCLVSSVLFVKTDAKRRRYFCDTWDEAELASVFGRFEKVYPSASMLYHRFRRMVGHGNEIYFVFNNRTFYTELIQIDQLADEELGPTSFLLGDIYVDEQVEDLTPYELFGRPGLNMGGHFYSSKNNYVCEFYRINVYDTTDIPDDPMHSELYKEYFHLDFSDGTPKRVDRSHLNKVRPQDDFRLGNQNLKQILNGVHPYKEINYVILIETDALKVAILNPIENFSGKHGNPEFSNKFSLVIQYWPKKGRFKDTLLTDEFGGRKVSRAEKRLDHLMFAYLLRVDAQNPVNYELFLIEVNSPQLEYPAIRLRLGYFTFRDRKATEWSVQISMDELLSCHTWDGKQIQEEARGIYYDRQSKVFYIFIKRFYLR